MVGILTVGLLNATTPEFAAGAASSPGASASEPPSTGSVPVTAQAQVNAACLRVINEAQDVYTTLQALEQAVTDVNLQQLDDMVRGLQPIQPRLARDLQGCRVDTEVTVSTPGTTPPPGTPQPSPTR